MANLKFSIANNAVTHLGRNLYSTTPPALAELIANSYDAYATEVNIRLSNDSIVIVDNGKGLDLVELAQKYAIIGSEKKEETPINGLAERKPMGKKGIGKLAAFSLGNVYTVYSKSFGSSTSDWLTFTLDYRQMTARNDYDVEVTETVLPAEFSDFEDYASGFIVKITDTRRSITEATRNNIRKQLSRRFYINQTKTNFELKIDGQVLELASNEYYTKIQYVVYFGDIKEDELKLKFGNVEILEKYSKNPQIATYFSSSNISGWIGTTNKPKDLKNEDGASFANIIVLANGKIADEDILKSKSNARIANNYIVGEIVADDFILGLDDPITSSRQGLDDSIPEVEELISNLDKVRDFVIERWDKIRRENVIEKLPERIKGNQSYKDWLSGLTKEQKSINNKLLDLFSSKLDDDVALDEKAVDSMVTSISTVINNIETDDLIASFEEEEDVNVQFSLLFKLMNNIAKMEDLNHGNLIRKRLTAIEKLEKLMADNGTAEKVFEEHLSDNPWLINPYWNVDRNTPTEIDYLRNQEFFNLDRGNEEFKRNFLDISIRVAEEKYPIIIELKKNTADGYARVNFNMINEQITNYRQAMIQKIPELSTVDETDIKVIFVLSEDTGMTGSGNKITFTDREKRMLDVSNITILKYNKIIAEARKMYKDHLEYQRDAKLIPDLGS